MRLQHDPEHNALQLLLDYEPAVPVSRRAIPGVVDVAANGRLVGIELQTGASRQAAERIFQHWLEDRVAAEFLSIDADGTVYLELTTGDADELSRSSKVNLTLELDAGRQLVSISIPRRGAGYEISYPSGNR